MSATTASHSRRLRFVAHGHSSSSCPPAGARGTQPLLCAVLLRLCVLCASCFDSAMEADAVIAHVLNAVGCRSDLAMHPLASWVFTRTPTHMIAWALAGAAPAAVPPATVEPPRRRGPSRGSPLLPPALLERFHTRMRRCAELADHADALPPGGAFLLVRGHLVSVVK